MAENDSSASAPAGAMRTCRKCGVTKPLEAFPKAERCKDGRRATCRPCHSAHNAKYRGERRAEGDAAFRDRKAQERAEHERLHAAGLRACRKCGEQRVLEFFPKVSSIGGLGMGRSLVCRPCLRANQQAWATRNPDRIAAHEQKALAKLRALTAERRAEAERNRPATRICVMCGIEADEALFRWPHGSRSSWCADCQKARILAKRALPENKQKKRDWYYANADEIARKSKISRRGRRARIAKTKRDYRRNNPENVRSWRRRRRAQKQGAGGRHTKQDVARIRVAQRDRCAICRIKLHGKGQIDHIVPLARGGSDNPSNLQITCTPCNNEKNAADPLDFMRKRGFLL